MVSTRRNPAGRGVNITQRTPNREYYFQRQFKVMNSSEIGPFLRAAVLTVKPTLPLSKRSNDPVVDPSGRTCEPHLAAHPRGHYLLLHFVRPGPAWSDCMSAYSPSLLVRGDGLRPPTESLQPAPLVLPPPHLFRRLRTGLLLFPL